MTKILVFVTLVLLARYAWAEDPEVLARFFGRDGIADKGSAYVDEMLATYKNEPTLGESLPPEVRVTFRPLYRESDSAVYAVLLSDGKRSQDWYAFLTDGQGQWKLSAVRTLSLTGVVYAAIDELEKRASLTEDEDFQYKNLKLLVSSDEALKAYLRGNLSEFDRAVAAMASGKTNEADLMAKALRIDSVSNDLGGVKFTIGGVVDNTVGFLFLPEGRLPPRMNAAEFIYIEQVVEGWYVYKTT